jgi:MoaE-MoaD fusion protein
LTVRIRLFAIMAQQAGTAALRLSLPENATAGGVQEALRQRFPDLRWPPGTLLAVNQEYALGDRPLIEDDEVAIIPPVSGG